MATLSGQVENLTEKSSKNDNTVGTGWKSNRKILKNDNTVGTGWKSNRKILEK